MLKVTLLLTLLLASLAKSQDGGNLTSSTARSRFGTPDIDSHVVIEVRPGDFNGLKNQAIPTTIAKAKGDAVTAQVVSNRPEPTVGSVASGVHGAASTAPPNSTTGTSLKPDVLAVGSTKPAVDNGHAVQNNALLRNDYPGFHMVEPLTQSVLHAGVQASSQSTTAGLETTTSRLVNGSTGESDTVPRDIEGDKVLTSAVPEPSTQHSSVQSGETISVASLDNSSETVSTFRPAVEVFGKTTPATIEVSARSLNDTVGQSTGIPLVQSSTLSDDLTAASKPPVMSTVAHSTLDANSTSTFSTENSDVRLRAAVEENGTVSALPEVTSTNSLSTEPTMELRAGPLTSTTAGTTVRSTAKDAVAQGSEHEATPQGTTGHTAAATDPISSIQSTTGLAARHQAVTLPTTFPPFAQAKAITAPDSEYIVPFAPLRRQIPRYRDDDDDDDDHDDPTHNLFIRRGYCGKCQRELRFCVQKCFETHSCEAPVNNVLTCPKIQIPCFPPYKPQPDECRSSADCEGLNHLCCLLGCSRKCVPGLVVPLGQH